MTQPPKKRNSAGYDTSKFIKVDLPSAKKRVRPMSRITIGQVYINKIHNEAWKTKGWMGGEVVIQKVKVSGERILIPHIGMVLKVKTRKISSDMKRCDLNTFSNEWRKIRESDL